MRVSYALESLKERCIKPEPIAQPALCCASFNSITIAANTITSTNMVGRTPKLMEFVTLPLELVAIVILDQLNDPPVKTDRIVGSNAMITIPPSIIPNAQ